jgi:hypothetical protein
MPESLKRLASAVLGVMLFLAIFIVIPTLFIFGAVKLSTILWPLLELLSILVFAIALLVLLPLSFLQPSRPFAAGAILIASYVFGATVWIDALLVTKVLWGTAAVVVGLLIAGVGIVPVGILAALFNAAWAQFWDLLVLTALTYGLRVYAFRVASKAERIEQIRALQSPSSETAG